MTPDTTPEKEQDILRKLDNIEKDLADLDAELDEFERDMEREIQAAERRKAGGKK